MVRRIPITKAQVNLGQVVRRLRRKKEYCFLEQDGIPVAGIMNADELEDYLELQDPQMKKQIANGYAEYLRGEARPAKEFLSELRGEIAKRGKKP